VSQLYLVISNFFVVHLLDGLGLGFVPADWFSSGLSGDFLILHIPLGLFVKRACLEIVGSGSDSGLIMGDFACYFSG
jgi:hypothetical protein